MRTVTNYLKACGGQDKIGGLMNYGFSLEQIDKAQNNGDIEIRNGRAFLIEKYVILQISRLLWVKTPIKDDGKMEFTPHRPEAHVFNDIKEAIRHRIDGSYAIIDLQIN